MTSLKTKLIVCGTKERRDVRQNEVLKYGAPFGKILYLTDLAQKLLSLAEIAISACRDVICGRDSYESILFLHLTALRGGELRLFLHLQVQKENALTERAR